MHPLAALGARGSVARERRDASDVGQNAAVAHKRSSCNAELGRPGS